MYFYRWNPKKRMAPDEALKHEWILQSSSQKSSSDLRHSQSEASVSQDSHSSSGTSGESISNYRLHHSRIISKSSDKSKAKLDSRVNDNRSIDANLNDSGTFLPPIL